MKKRNIWHSFLWPFIQYIRRYKEFWPSNCDSREVRLVEDTTIRDDKCRRRANPQIDRPARPPRYVALIGTFRCTIGILSRQWWNCSEHFQTSHNPGGNLGDRAISKPACAWNTCATCAHLRDTLHLMESYYGFNQSIQLPTFALKEELLM